MQTTGLRTVIGEFRCLKRQACVVASPLLSCGHLRRDYRGEHAGHPQIESTFVEHLILSIANDPDRTCSGLKCTQSFGSVPEQNPYTAEKHGHDLKRLVFSTGMATQA